MVHIEVPTIDSGTDDGVAPMLLKDLATLIVSIAALVTSASIAFFNYRVQRAREHEDARKSLEEAIAGLQSSRGDWAKLRGELGGNFDHPDAVARRVTIVERRNTSLSKANYLLRTKRPLITSADAIILASSMIDSGRIAAAVPLYRIGMELAEDDLDVANAQRVLGRAMIVSRNAEAGRDHMLAAADIYQRLARNPDYDGREMVTHAAETFRRLVDAYHTSGIAAPKAADLEMLESLHHAAAEPTRAMSRDLLTIVKTRHYALPEGEAF